jgi:hypothetical protein
MPRKRVKFDEKKPVVFIEPGSDLPVFKYLGGYFTHNSYRLLDYFTSHWFEVARKKWTQEFGGKYPKNFGGKALEKLAVLTPMFNGNGSSSVQLENDLLDLCRSMQDYAIIEEVSDRQMRKHPSLKGISSAELFEIIKKTSKARLKTNYPVRSLKRKGKKTFIGWETWSNLNDTASWSKLFDYRLLDEKKGADGRIIERIYKFGFNTPLGIAMIHNTICGGFWSVNTNLYQVSADAQLLYRYLVITGSRKKNNSAEFIGYRIGWREKQKKRLASRLEALFQELCEAKLITSYVLSSNCQSGYLFSFEIGKRNGSKNENKGAGK